MAEKFNSILSEADHQVLAERIRQEHPDAVPEGWDGLPMTPPTLTARAWWIDPYWYVATSNGVHRVTGQPGIVTDEDLIWSVGEQVRILLLPQYRIPVVPPASTEADGGK